MKKLLEGFYRNNVLFLWISVPITGYKDLTSGVPANPKNMFVIGFGVGGHDYCKGYSK